MTAKPSAILQATDAQATAANPYQHAWVSANAGTGKTKVLSDRYLALLLAGNKPEQILCLTYTNAGAGEMANRITSQLSRWAYIPESDLIDEITTLEKPYIKHIQPSQQTQTNQYQLTRDKIAKARQLFTDVLDCPEGLKIQTIHAFCQSILARFPLEAQISPALKLIEDHQVTNIVANATNIFLQKHLENPRIHKALSILIDETAPSNISLLFDAIQNEINEQNFTQIDDLIKQWLGSDQALEPITLTKQIVTERLLDDQDLYAIIEHKIGRDKNSYPPLQSWLAYNAQDRLKHFELYQNYFLTKKATIITAFENKRRKAHDQNDITELDLATRCQKEANRILDLLHRIDNIRLAQNTRAMFDIFKVLAPIFDHEKKRQGVVTYNDLINLTASLFSSSDTKDWVLYKLDHNIRHILIDEAQDTNPKQWKIIAELCALFFTSDDSFYVASQEQSKPKSQRNANHIFGKQLQWLPRTLFAVGDIKQSIYRFQGARPIYFEEHRKRFSTLSKQSNVGFENVPMQTSFRSGNAQLQLIDQVFANDEVPLSEQKITPKHQSYQNTRHGHVELWPVLRPQTNLSSDQTVQSLPAPSCLQLLCTQIADTIKSMIGTCWVSSKQRYAREGDFMILVAKRRPLMDPLTRALRKAGIAVSPGDKTNLLDEPAIIDIMSLLRFLSLPQDDLSLAEALRSPFIGANEQDIMDLVADKFTHNRQSIWETLLHQHTTHLNPAIIWLKKLLSATDQIALYDLIRMCLDLACPGPFLDQKNSSASDIPIITGRCALAQRLGNDINHQLESFSEFVSQYEIEQPSSLGAFIEYAQERASSLQKKQAKTNQNHVHIVTVHSAKGLEAPIILLPENIRSDNPKSDAISNIENENGLQITINKPAKWIGNCIDDFIAFGKQQEEYEKNRLLYVALTRSEDRLIIMAADNKSETNKKPYQGPPKHTWYTKISNGLHRLANTNGFQRQELVQNNPNFTWYGPKLIYETGYSQLQSSKPTPTSAPDPIELPAWVHTTLPLERETSAIITPSKIATSPNKHAKAFAKPANKLALLRGRFIHLLLEKLPNYQATSHLSIALRIAKQFYGLPQPTIDEAIDTCMTILNDPVFADIFTNKSRGELGFASTLNANTLAHIMPKADLHDLQSNKSKNGNTLIIGRIDRLVITNTHVLIVEYKSNVSIPKKPEAISNHILAQLSAYYHAAEQIYPNKPIQVAILWTHAPSLMHVPNHLLSKL